jgi:hypothetical protein
VQLLKNFLAFYGTRKFITVLTRASTGDYSDKFQRNESGCLKYTYLFCGLLNDALSSWNILWNVDPLLGNDREISKHITAVAE